MEVRQKQLLSQIDLAFVGVELGDGVSLHESQVIDNYGGAEERLAARASDEKVDWHKLIDETDLTRLFNVGMGGLCFLDAAGVRFHLPACLSLIVIDHSNRETGNMMESLLYRLAEWRQYGNEHLAHLNEPQRACVKAVLIYLQDTQDYDNEMLERIIEGY